MSAWARIEGAAILNAAADRISRPDAWAQLVSATMSDGHPCPVYSGGACAWCASGAIRRECWEVTQGRDRREHIDRAMSLWRLLEAKLRLAGLRCMADIVTANDADGATPAEVCALLREIAGECDAKGISLPRLGVAA